MSNFGLTILRYTNDQFLELGKNSRIELTGFPDDLKDEISVVLGSSDMTNVYYKLLEISTGNVRTFSEVVKPDLNTLSTSSESSSSESSSSESSSSENTSSESTSSESSSDNKELINYAGNQLKKNDVGEHDKIFEIETHIFCVDTKLFLEKYNSLNYEKNKLPSVEN